MNDYMNENREVLPGQETSYPENVVTFTKEELADGVKVPPVVEQDLRRIISDRLEQCGLYYRCFSRIKTAQSMARKFDMKDLNEEHKLQDLIGVRINLYFDDDVDICRDIMAQTFDVIEWSTSKRSEDEFKPAKLNGVFRLPAYLKEEISPQTWNMCIDDTFEIQIKTMFFEGWHEVEHDMRYKGEELWSHYPGFSRYFNSILATLELCDKSMVTLFEDLGHALYKSGRWSDMIKSHFRLKLGEAQLYPEVEQILNEDMARSDNLAKRIFRTPRPILIGQLLSRTRHVPINVNTIIALLNESIFHDDRLTAVFRHMDVFNDGRDDTEAESRHYELRPFRPHTVFQMMTRIDGNRMKTEEEITDDLLFEESAKLIWRWIRMKYGVLFHNMPEQVSTYQAYLLAYHIEVKYHPERRVMKVHVRHTDPEANGRIWYTEACLHEVKEGEGTRQEHTPGIWIDIINGYAQPDPEDSATVEEKSTNFSYPGFYKNIVDMIGVVSSLPCSGRRRILKEDEAETIAQAIMDPERQFPIVLIISKEDANGMMDEDWLMQFRVSDFTRTVWRYAHVLCCYENVGRQILKLAGDVRFSSEPQVPRFYVYWPDGTQDDYGADDVENCAFGRHLEARGDARTYDIVYGGQAFYHKIVTDLRDWNVNANMWKGFQLDVMPGIPDD